MLIQVSPVERGGVFDYLQCLGDEWSQVGQPSIVLSLSRALAQERSLDERVGDICRRHGRPAHGDRCSLVLHFSGYGYADRGLCFWLLRELQTLRERRRGSLHLVVVFHELFAVGPPWRSAFWVSSAQRWIASRLAHMADVVWTNTARHAAWLRIVVPRGTPQHARPVFSNVGEPLSTVPTAERLARAVVFGSAPTRQRVFAALRPLEPALRALGVEELVEAGSGQSTATPRPDLPCRHAGRLSHEHLGSLLQSSRFGLLDYQGDGLAKSGVYAAYAAHGCVVLNTHPGTTNGDGLNAGEHFLSLPGQQGPCVALHALEAVSGASYGWYQEHRLRQQAHQLLALAQGYAAPLHHHVTDSG